MRPRQRRIRNPRLHLISYPFKESKKQVAMFWFLFAVGGLIFTEYHFYEKNFVRDKILNNVMSITHNASILSLFDNQLVHVMGVTASIPARQHLSDPDFGISFPDAIQFTRIVQYCQWRQVKKVRTKIVGHKPHRCLYRETPGTVCPTARVAYKQCKNLTDRISCENGTCCYFMEGKKITEDEIYFEYSKDWRNRLIASDAFKNLSYKNPQRNPFPTVSQRQPYATIRLPDGTELHTDAKHLSFRRPIRTTISRLNYDKLSNLVIDSGFFQADTKWFFSNYSNFDQQVKTWKNVEDTRKFVTHESSDPDIQDECIPGDIRVGFEYKLLPSKVSIIAKLALQNKELVPYFIRYIEKNVYYAVEGLREVESILGREDAVYWMLALGFKILIITILIIAVFLYKYSGKDKSH